MGTTKGSVAKQHCSSEALSPLTRSATFSMRDNMSACISSERTVLYPYRPEHVEPYHEGMKDPWLQEMTASEPLSLEEEIEMQRTWREDADKCTFIVLDRERASEAAPCGAMAGDVESQKRLFSSCLPTELKC